MHKLVLIRHGEPEWVRDGLNVVNPPLTERGQLQAQRVGAELGGEHFDEVIVSPLLRARQTAAPLLAALGRPETVEPFLEEKYGDEQVLIWRRSYDTPPPALTADDPRGQRGDIRYARLEPAQVPLTECLKDTVERVLPCWHERIAPAIRGGQRLLIAAHGNSMRAMVKYLDGISDADIVGLNIPNGIPLVYELDADLKPIRSYYLGDAEAAAKAAAAVAAQGKA